MNTTNHYTPPDTHESAADAYEQSERFITDAIEYVSVAPDLPGWLVLGICQWYATTSKFATVVDDLMSGEV